MKSQARHLFVLICLGTAVASWPLHSANAQESPLSAPTDSDIFYSGAFQLPLIPVGGATTPFENSALRKAITLYAETKDQDDHSAILGFLREFPQSPWRTSLLNNLGLRYRQTGWFLRALAAWGEAWDLSRDDKSRFGKPLADCIIGELAQLNADLGRRAEVETILKEVRGRPLIGPAMEKITVASEGLWMMRHEPENTFRCGPLALARLAACNNPKAARDPKILSVRSTEHGTSLSELWRLSREAGMNLQMAKREPGSTIIVPSLVNWKANHFAALVREDQGNFVVQDPTSNELLAVSTAALDAESSGYFLVPDGPLPTGWSRVSASEGEAVWGAGGTRAHHDTGTTPWDDKARCPEPAPKGMATYNFHTQLVSLNIMDTPVGYTPPRGPDMHFTITYNQRERAEANYNYFSTFGPIPGSGQLWVCNWIAHVQRSGAGWPVYVHLPGGGVESQERPDLDPGPRKQSGAIVTLENNLEIGDYYKRVLPDGSTQLFELLANGSRYLMTKWIDPQGNTILFNYCPENNCANYHPARPRLLSVSDALGQVSMIEYRSDDPENIPDYFLIERITDPFGRYAWFEYYGNGQLWKIHDAIGIVSEFGYEPGTDFIDTLITPYKTTNFSHPPSNLEDEWAENARVIQAVDAVTEATERVEFGHAADGIDAEETTLPDVGFTVYDGLYHMRNSFYWDKKSTAMYPPQNGVYDYTKAKIIHWLHRDNNTASNIKEREKMPLEKAVYYFYPGQGVHQNATAFEGSSGFPSVVARLLGDNTTQHWKYEYNNPFHKLTKATDPADRVTSYQYAANHIDLVAVFQSNPEGESTNPDNEPADLIFHSTYTDTESHLPHVVTDAAGQTTTYTYTAFKQLETVTNAKGEITAYEYGDGSQGKPAGYLAKIISPSFNGLSATTTFTYDEDHRVHTVTAGPDNYTVTTEYDALDRPTQITYPDGTSSLLKYTRYDEQNVDTGVMTLDLTASRDRLGRWTYRHYDADRQMDSITDPLNRTTLYDWCTCGSLESITDPKEQTTIFHRDLQGRVHQKVFADSTTINYLFEGQTAPNTAGATSRLKSMTDALNQTTDYQYFDDDNLERVSYTNAQNPTPSVNYTYDIYNRVKTMNDGTGLTEYEYYQIDSPPALGAGKLQSVDGPLVNDTITFTYDELGRTHDQSINGATQTLTYDSLGRLDTTTNPLGPFTRMYDGVTPRLETFTYPNGQTANYAYFGNTEDRRLQTLQNVAPGAVNLSTFNYTYDTEGQIQTWNRLLGVNTSNMTLGYDDARQLLSASRDNQVLQYGYDTAANRSSDSIFNPFGQIPNGTFHSYSLNVLNQIESFSIEVDGIVDREVEPVYDLVGNLTDDGQGKTFEWDAANRPVAINYISSGARTEFAYDGLGRRAKIIEYGPGATATVQPIDSDYATFNTAPFTLPSGSYTLTFEGLNSTGGGMALIDSVTLNNTLVPNGSFESPVVEVTASGGGYEYNPVDSAWSFIGRSGIAANLSDFTSRNPDAPDGSQVAFIEDGGHISQIWTTLAGAHTLSFQAAQSGNSSTMDQQVRVTLRPSGAAAIVKTFVWCGNQICEERDSSGGTVTKRFFAEGEQRIGGSDAGNYYYSRDHLGSIREVTDSSGTLKAVYDYDPYGKSVVIAGNMNVDFGYTGHYFHAPSGMNLTLYRAYNPALGRWLSRDPLSLAEILEGSNLYTYVGNDPLNAVDPLGQWQVTIFGGKGWAGYLTFGKNSGQWNVSLRGGVGAGFSAAIDFSDSGCRETGWSGNLSGTGALGQGVLGGGAEIGVAEPGPYISLGGRAGRLTGGLEAGLQIPGNNTFEPYVRPTGGITNAGAGFALTAGATYVW